MFKHFQFCLLAVLIATATRAQQFSGSGFPRDVQPSWKRIATIATRTAWDKRRRGVDKFNPDASPADSRDLGGRR